MPGIPETMLARAGKAIDGIWKAVDAYRASPPAGIIQWDPRVFLPLDGWHRLIREAEPNISEERRYYKSLLLSTAGAWRPGQDVVRFDPDLQAMLAKTPISGDLPAETLARLPAWSVWFDSGPMTVNGRDFEGFFAALEQDEERTRLFLRMIFAGRKGRRAILLPLGPWSLEKAVFLANELVRRNRGRNGLPIDETDLPYVDAGLHAALNLVLYVCSLNGERPPGLSRIQVAAFSFPQAKKTRHSGWRLFPPAKPKIHFLGKGLGERLREAAASDTVGMRSGPSPHIRKAHWHGYWNGPRKGERSFELKWLPPIPVAMREKREEADENDAVSGM